MKITVRLYRTTDLDLIGLACGDGVSVSKELKKCLVSFVRGVPYSINLNPIDVSRVIMTKKSVTLQFYLEPKSYSDVITWLKTIRPRQRNSFLKNLLRSSLPCPYLYMYQTNPALVSHMIGDIYDRQIALEMEKMAVVEEESTPTPVSTAKPVINKKPETTKTVITNFENKTEETKSVLENKYKNPSPIVEMATNESHYQPVEETETYTDSSNGYSQDEEDALFDALFNL